MSDHAEPRLAVKLLFEDNRSRMMLQLHSGSGGLQRQITEKDIHRPGLALTGFTEQFPHQRVQVLGEAEILYLESLDPARRTSVLHEIFRMNIPCVIVTNNSNIPIEISAAAEEFLTPVFKTPLSTTDLTHLLIDYLDDMFAPRLTIHGSLVDVYGTGILFSGRSGIGKSEIALDLVERGHRLVSDDVVVITKKAEGVLIGTGSEMLRHLMEIRGVGIIDVRRMFGVRAIRQQKRVEMEVELVEWDEKEDYERLGLEESKKEILGVKIDYVKLPIFPGKNITVIAESLALNLHLRVYGYHPAREFSEKLLRTIQDRRRIAQYLERDLE